MEVVAVLSYSFVYAWCRCSPVFDVDIAAKYKGHSHKYNFHFFVMINFLSFDFSSLNLGKVIVSKLNHCSSRINFLHEKVVLEVCVNGSHRAQTILAQS